MVGIRCGRPVSVPALIGFCLFAKDKHDSNKKAEQTDKLCNFPKQRKNIFFHLDFLLSVCYNISNPYLGKRADALPPYVRSLIKIISHPTKDIISIASLLSCCINLISSFTIFWTLSIGITSFLCIYIISHIAWFVKRFW